MANSSPAPAAGRYEQVDRCVQGISALFLAIRRRPVIRYQSGSEHVQKLAEGLYSLMYKQVRVTALSYVQAGGFVSHESCATALGHACSFAIMSHSESMM